MAVAQPLKLCVLVKEVPEPGAGAQVASASGRLDRSGASAMNPFDAQALEAAVRLRDATAERPVGETVAVTMGPPSAAAVLRRAISLGADRGVHLRRSGARRRVHPGHRLRARARARA